MTYEIPGQTRSYEAVADLSASQFKFVKLAGGVLVAVAAATDNAVGVLQNKPNAAGVGVFKGGERTSATVMITGVTRARATGAIPAGSVVYLAADGSVTTAAQAGRSVGITETASAVTGDLVSLLIKPLGSFA